jgi:hypothetical protein
MERGGREITDRCCSRRWVGSTPRGCTAVRGAERRGADGPHPCRLVVDSGSGDGDTRMQKRQRSESEGHALRRRRGNENHAGNEWWCGFTAVCARLCFSHCQRQEEEEGQASARLRMVHRMKVRDRRWSDRSKRAKYARKAIPIPICEGGGGQEQGGKKQTTMFFKEISRKSN